MVPESHYPESIPYILVWCKKCTRELDKRIGKQYHNIWELGWIKKDYFSLVDDLFENIKDGRNNWSLESLKQVNKLGKIALNNEETS